MQGWIISSFALDHKPKKTGAGSRWELCWAGCCYTMLILLNGPMGMWKEWRGPSANEGLISIIYSRSAEKGHGVECLQAVLLEALSIKTRKRQFPWQWLRVLRGAASLVVCLDIQDTWTMREPFFRDLGQTVWLGRERTNYISDKCSLHFWLEEKKGGPKEYLFELF